MPTSVAASEQGEGLGNGKDLFVGEAIEGKLVSLFAREYGAPGAPVLFGTENNQLLSALFARKDDLLLWKTLHLYAPPFASLWGVAFVVVVLASRWATQKATSHTRRMGTR